MLNYSFQRKNDPNQKKVDGIIGADLLKKGKAVIDYHRNYLYLK